MGGTILQQIIETKRREMAEARTAFSIESVRDAAKRAAAPRDFYAAVTAPPPLRLIAEIKKASPSAGLIRADFDPVQIARTYESAGAAALSVLTDRTYFQGELAFIERVKAAVKLPVLRKDFIVDEYQVYESRAAGADAILLIAAALSRDQIEIFSEIASRSGMATLIEVHGEDELRAVHPLLDRGRRMLLGINNRDLATQRVDLDTVERLAALAGPEPFVAESGLKSRDDLARMKRAGASAVLIGEILMSATDIAGKVRELFD
jgi:indole-3-glycerol phosphate synthase